MRALIEDWAIQDPRATVKAGDLYAAYRIWCDQNGHQAASGTLFGHRLDERGFAKGRGPDGGKVRRGLRLTGAARY